MIKVSALQKHYQVDGRELTALADIDLDIPEGEIFGIIGRSGAGKSTLIRCLNLLERPNGGAVEVDGQDLTRLPKRALQLQRRQIGMVFQHFNLLSSRSVAGNVRFPLELAGQLGPAEIEQRVDELLALVGLSEHRDKYPAQLSGGQKQRVGIARALANRPRLLLCDEATSALDPETTDSILALLADINRRFGLTIVLITHEMRVIRDLCDCVAVLDQGRIVEQGAVLDVFLHPQHAVTRSLLAETGLHTADGASNWRQRFDGPLLKLTTVGAPTLDPVLDTLSREYGLRWNLIHGTVADIKGTPFGQLVIGLIDPPMPPEQVRAVLTRHGVHSEVLA